MSDIYVPGVKSRFDTNKLVDDLMKVERIPKERSEKSIENLQAQKTYWQDLGRRITALRDSARFLYSFQNPFNDRVVNSSDPAVISATATREAAEQEYSFTVKQIAKADRFLSEPLADSFKIEEGTYTFGIGQDTITFPFKGGSLREFSDTLNRRGRGKIASSLIAVQPGKKSLLIESKITGADNKLLFLDAAENLGVEAGMLGEKSGSSNIPLKEDVVQVKAGETAFISLDINAKSSRNMKLKFEIAMEEIIPPAASEKDAENTEPPPATPATPTAPTKEENAAIAAAAAAAAVEPATKAAEAAAKAAEAAAKAAEAAAKAAEAAAKAVNPPVTTAAEATATTKGAEATDKADESAEEDTPAEAEPTEKPDAIAEAEDAPAEAEPTEKPDALAKAEEPTTETEPYPAEKPDVLAKAEDAPAETDPTEIIAIQEKQDAPSSVVPSWKPLVDSVKRIDNMNVLYLTFSDGTNRALPPIKDSADFSSYEYRLFDIVGEKTVVSLEMVNQNTHRNVSIRNIQAINPDVESGGIGALKPVSEAQDAIVTMEGIEINRSTNVISDLIPGVTLNARAPSDKPITLKVESDRQGIKDAVITLVASYNRLVADINVLTRNDDRIIQELTYLSTDEQEELRKRMGTFAGDSILGQFRNTLQRVAAAPYTTSGEQDLALLAQIGIGTDVRGSGGSGYDPSRLRGYLEIDEKVLDSALETNLAAVQQLFGYDSDGDYIVDSGVAYTFETLAKPYTEIGGIIALKTGSIDSRIAQENRRIETLDRQLAAKEAALKNQYGQMEGAYNRMDRMNSSLDQFSQQNSNNRK